VIGEFQSHEVMGFIRGHAAQQQVMLDKHDRLQRMAIDQKRIDSTNFYATIHISAMRSKLTSQAKMISSYHQKQFMEDAFGINFNR
jgi:hypothetical protein